MKVESSKAKEHVDINHLVIRDGSLEIHAHSVTYYEDSGDLALRLSSSDTEALAVIENGRLKTTMPTGFEYGADVNDGLKEKIIDKAKELNGVSFTHKYPMQGGPT